LGELKLLHAKSTNYVTKEQAKQHTDIIGEDFMTFWAKTITKLDIHLKADFVEKDSIARIENNCEQIP
jgi:cell division transport system permease protein